MANYMWPYHASLQNRVSKS
uniref:Uncharacterized protein n=1 Tax=Arundo donax TaxID=35708 RepID=A0A0A9B9H3_ARUDO